MQRLNSTSLALCLLLAAGAPALAQNSGSISQQATPSAKQDSNLPSIDKVLSSAVESIGGREKLEEIKNLHTVMTMSVMGSTITTENKWSREGGRFNSNQSPFGNSEMGTDGKVAWMKMPGDRYVIMEEEQAKQLDGQASLHMNLLDPKRMREDMETLEVVAQEEFNGNAAYKVRFVPKDNQGSGFMYFDARDGRPLGMTQTDETPMGKQTTTITLGDWKTIEGVQFFHKMTIESPNMPGGSVEMKVTKLEVNALDESTFELPEQVKELAASEEAGEGEGEGDQGSANAGDEIKLEDLAEAHQERARMMVEQMKSGGKEAIDRMMPRLEQTLESMPEGDDKLTMRYVIQELKKVK
ncbi:hypothetical protein AY599_11410 [Leptolyngbya valderiana BDU 20041]|nr:hypothetical protein AY599_11410 [Leptolyngbya valderiana BDU 20041]